MSVHSGPHLHVSAAHPQVTGERQPSAYLRAGEPRWAAGRHAARRYISSTAAWAASFKHVTQISRNRESILLIGTRAANPFHSRHMLLTSHLLQLAARSMAVVASCCASRDNARMCTQQPRVNMRDIRAGAKAVRIQPPRARSRMRLPCDQCHETWSAACRGGAWVKVVRAASAAACLQYTITGPIIGPVQPHLAQHTVDSSAAQAVAEGLKQGASCLEPAPAAGTSTG